jgi:hypothetical protein
MTHAERNQRCRTRGRIAYAVVRATRGPLGDPMSVLLKEYRSPLRAIKKLMQCPDGCWVERWQESGCANFVVDIVLRKKDLRR